MKTQSLKYLMAAVLTAGTASAHAVKNECNATVRPNPVQPVADGAGVLFKFTVRTDCPGSTGKFDYTFTVGGKRLDRTSPSWTTSDGNPATVKASYSAPLSEVGPATVDPESMQSTRTTKQ